MDHIVYLDHKARELDMLLAGTKRMIIRGAGGRKMPHGRVQTGDRLFFVNNNGDGLIRAQAAVTDSFHSDKMDKETSEKLVKDHMTQLQLTAAQMKRWAGKRYLVLISVDDIQPVEPFGFDRTAYGNMDDWLPVENIESIKK